MPAIRHESKGKEIRNLLLVIGSGMFGAFVVALGMLYYYNPSGSYLAGNVLLSPESTQIIKFKDTNPHTGGTAKFVFDQIEFSYYDTDQKKWKRSNVQMDHYAKFYQTVSYDRSIQKTEEMEKQFNHSTPSVLKLKIRTEEPTNSTSKSFIEVSFVPDGNYYRIELHEENAPESWAYFYHTDIYQKAYNLFIPAS